MQEVRAVVYGVGAMGSIVTRLLLEKGVKIVGAVGRSPEKVGKDLGEVAGLDRDVGVTVVSDHNKAFEAGADIAIVCVSSYLKVMHDHFAICLEHGANVITIEEETVYPWSTAPELARELDQLAKANGVTLAASGAQDVFWLYLVSTLLGAAHRVDEVNGRCMWNVDDYGPEVAFHLRVGEEAEAFEHHVRDHGWSEFVARQSLEALVSELGLSISSIDSSVEPVSANEPIFCKSLNRSILPGHLIGTVDTTEVRTAEGPRFSFSMEGRVYTADQTDMNEWHVTGEPNLHLRNDRASYRFTTCTSVVNRIPDVMNAAPGLVSLDQLGKPSYRHQIQG